MKKYIFFLLFISLGLFAISCSDKEETIIPNDISDIRLDAKPGFIVLRWERQENDNIFYVKCMYHDHRLNIDEVRLSSCDSIVIPDTRKKYGEYNFQLQPVSKTFTGGEIHTISGESLPAPVVPSNDITQIKFKAGDMVSPQEHVGDGSVNNLFDGNPNSHFHSCWNGSKGPLPHWIDITLPEVLKAGVYLRMKYTNRNHNNRCRPTDLDLEGSMDGEDWFVIKHFTAEDDQLNLEKSGTYTSPNMRIEKDIKMLRYKVNKTLDNSGFFALGELEFFTVKVYDPELED